MRTGWLSKFPLAVIYAAPLAALVSLAVFVSAVMLKVGHFPAYSQPDPKHVEGLGGLYLLTMFLLTLAVLSPAIVVAHLAWRKLAGGERTDGPRVTLYALGAALCAVIILGDALKLRTWLLD
jgi:hypothetical protein